MTNPAMINGVLRNKEHPNTFHIPPEEERKNLPIGSFAKVGFEDPAGGGERMWFRIVSATNGRYIGELNNHPAVVDGLQYGDKVEFGPEHVLAVEAPIQKN